MQKKQKPKKDVKVEVLYLGKTIDSIGNIRHLFRDKKGQRHLFRSIKLACFGDCFMMINDTLARRPEALENPSIFPTEAERLDYETRKLIVAHSTELKRKIMFIKKPHKDIVYAINLLRPFCKSMDFLTLERFTAYLKQQISKKGK
jgi:hypothetical protein